MTKKILFLLSILFCVCVSAQDVRYYKLTRTKIKGIDNRNVSGGQFITFVGNQCFESNKKGVGVNHGTLTRNVNYSNSQYTIYQGSSYWGSSTTFKFNADKSTLNVVLDNGDIYVYKRATPPAGVTTCSLIRKRSNNEASRSGGGFSPQPTPNPQFSYPNPQPSPSPGETPNPNPRPRYVEKTYQCRFCNGRGTVPDCDGGIVDFTKSKKYCNECGMAVPMCHIHKRCPSCGGKGSYTKMEQTY